MASDDSLKALHDELEFPKWESELRRVGGIWQQLQQLQKQARRDPAAVKPYRSYLERCLRNLKAHDIELSADDATIREADWVREYRSFTDRLADRIASRLPRGVEPWCEKWLPRVHEDYRIAVNAVKARATSRNYDRLMEAMAVMFDEFEKAI